MSDQTWTGGAPPDFEKVRPVRPAELQAANVYETIELVQAVRKELVTVLNRCEKTLREVAWRERNREIAREEMAADDRLKSGCSDAFRELEAAVGRLEPIEDEVSQLRVEAGDGLPE